jgi:hypothetical protein
MGVCFSLEGKMSFCYLNLERANSILTFLMQLGQVTQPSLLLVFRLYPQFNQKAKFNKDYFFQPPG